MLLKYLSKPQLMSFAFTMETVSTSSFVKFEILKTEDLLVIHRGLCSRTVLPEFGFLLSMYTIWVTLEWELYRRQILRNSADAAVARTSENSWSHGEWWSIESETYVRLTFTAAWSNAFYHFIWTFRIISLCYNFSWIQIPCSLSFNSLSFT